MSPQISFSIERIVVIVVNEEIDDPCRILVDFKIVKNNIKIMPKMVVFSAEHTDYDLKA